MKKILLFAWMLLTVISLSACVGSDDEPITPEQPETPEQPGGGDDNDNEPEKPTPGGNGRYLVLYASRTSNTERVAQLIQSTLNCDILEVEPQTPYDDDYNSMLERSEQELAAIRQGDYPPIRRRSKNSMTMISSSSVIRSGTAAWRHRCRLSCMNTPQNSPASGLRCSPPAAAAGFRRRPAKPADFAPTQRLSTGCCY